MVEFALIISRSEVRTTYLNLKDESGKGALTSFQLNT